MQVKDIHHTVTVEVGVLVPISVRAPSIRTLAFKEILTKAAEEQIRIKRRQKGVRLHHHTRGTVMDYVPLSIFQTTLDEFIGGE